ncbi:hypothetical protein GCM10010172_06760 [Paractinoplanes ferrugineus]|uniref:Uncharacterized protein n=1 Tax=Paractinoplanes ferrugineus TaxID=113564 RepID=A0A919JFK8_9ACTN|nr:hypothetical protein [Actinoplanes ferrugineus]GIE16296.1 hypothetical protein Afe05nite_81360 [Actinoplanes ferrugineus]
MATYTDALGATRAWINSRTDTLVGPNKPLWLGAYLKKVQGGTPACYAYLEEGFSVRTGDSPEDPDLVAQLSAQVYGGNGATREAVTDAAVALAEEISTGLCGVPALVEFGDKRAWLFVADDLAGPSWFPDGDLPRMLLNFTVRVRPA